jgi:site-specific recombinase XerC
VGELCDLRISDVTLGERKQRIVMLMNDTRKDLTEWQQVRPSVESDCLFAGQSGEAIQPRLARRKWNTCRARPSPSGAEPFKWQQLYAAAGDYMVGFIIEDLDGNQYPVYTNVTVR